MESRDHDRMLSDQYSDQVSLADPGKAGPAPARHLTSAALAAQRSQPSIHQYTSAPVALSALAQRTSGASSYSTVSVAGPYVSRQIVPIVAPAVQPSAAAAYAAATQQSAELSGLSLHKLNSHDVRLPGVADITAPVPFAEQIVEAPAAVPPPSSSSTAAQQSANHACSVVQQPGRTYSAFLQPAAGDSTQQQPFSWRGQVTAPAAAVLGLSTQTTAAGGGARAPYASAAWPPQVPATQQAASGSAPSRGAAALAPARGRISRKDLLLIEEEKVVYQESDCIGRGGFGKVYRGEFNDDYVAVKVLAAGHRAAAQALLQEGMMMQQLGPHPNIIGYHGLLLKGGKIHGIVMEYADGGSLDEALRVHGRGWSNKMKLDIALQIAQGLNFIQSQQVLHQDVKPSNVLVTGLLEDVYEPVAKLADFGITHQVSHTETFLENAGTAAYMAPEQLVFAAKVKAYKVAVWQFAMVMIYLLSGGQIRPFAKEPLIPDDPVSVVRFRKRLEAGLRPPIPEGYPPRVKALIELCWENDPARRPGFDWIIQEIQSIKTEWRHLKG